MKKHILIPFLILCAGSAEAQTLSGEEILQRVDRNMVVEQAVSVSTMIIHGRSGTRTITSKAWTKGEHNAFVEYLSPPREKGKKMLRLGDMLWTYTPEPNDRIITISGHLLRQSVMGSDLSYEDMMENDKMTIRASTQTPFPLKDQVAETLGFAPEKVRVIPPFVGGGFGGKTVISRPSKPQSSLRSQESRSTWHGLGPRSFSMTPFVRLQ